MTRTSLSKDMSVILGVVFPTPTRVDHAHPLDHFFENCVGISPLDVSLALVGIGDLMRQIL